MVALRCRKDVGSSSVRLTPLRAGQEESPLAAPSVWLDMTRPYRRIVGA
jgi:hypothetical protein